MLKTCVGMYMCQMVCYLEEGSTTNSCPTGLSWTCFCFPSFASAAAGFFIPFPFFFALSTFSFCFFCLFFHVNLVLLWSLVWSLLCRSWRLLWRPPFALSLCFCFCLCFSLCKGYTSWPLQVRISPILFSCVCFIFFWCCFLFSFFFWRFCFFLCILCSLCVLYSLCFLCLFGSHGFQISRSGRTRETSRCGPFWGDQPLTHQKKRNCMTSAHV